MSMLVFPYIHIHTHTYTQGQECLRYSQHAPFMQILMGGGGRGEAGGWEEGEGGGRGVSV
jgi:hypothetical protein